MVPLGAIAAVLLAVFGANALTLSFGYVTEKLLPTLRIKDEYGTMQTKGAYGTMRTVWSSNKGKGTLPNDPKSTLKTCEVFEVERYEGYRVLGTNPENLCFEAIKKHSGWPPDRAGWFDRGLREYSIVVEIQSTKESEKAEYIALDDAGRFYVLVPAGDEPKVIGKYKDRKVYPADADGVVMFAKEHRDLFSHGPR
jgi:hypothetical protein